MPDDADDGVLSKGIRALPRDKFVEFRELVGKGIEIPQALDQVTGGPGARAMQSFQKSLNDQFEAFKAQQSADAKGA